MISRYLFYFCVLAFLANVLNVNAQQEDDEDTDPRGFFSNSLVKKAGKLIGETFANAAASCVEEAAKACKHDLFPPKKLFKCAGNYFEENKGRCLLE